MEQCTEQGICDHAQEATVLAMKRSPRYVLCVSDIDMDMREMLVGWLQEVYESRLSTSDS
jgi:hypothetical protein